MLAAYTSFGMAFIARPVGAIAFGHFGDRIGRKATLVASLLLMGGCTVAIGFLPTYAMVGWIAPAILCLLRFGQGFGLGGEFGGAVLLAVENAPPGYSARYGMFRPLGAPVGFIAANGLFLLLGATLTDAQFVAWGWRLPFLASAVLVILGLWARLKLTETPAFAAALKEAPPPQVPLAELLKGYPRETIGGVFVVVCCFAIFYLTTAFALGYGKTMLGYSREAFLSIQLAAIPFMAIGIVRAGYWSDATTPRRVLMLGCALTVPAGFFLGPMLAGGAFTVWLFLSAALLVMGYVDGPLGAFLPGLFPARARYTGVSVSFNLGGIIGGAAARIAAQLLADSGGLPVVGLYLTVAAPISLVALVPLRRSAHLTGGPPINM